MNKIKLVADILERAIDHCYCHENSLEYRQVLEFIKEQEKEIQKLKETLKGATK